MADTLKALRTEYAAFSEEAAERVLRLETLMLEMAYAIEDDKAEPGSKLSKKMLVVTAALRDVKGKYSWQAKHPYTNK